MSLPVILRPAAIADVRCIHDNYEAVRAGLGRQFAIRVKQTLEQIEFMPEMFGIIWYDVRAVRLRQFRHVVYYVVFDDHVDVLAILHGSRNESSWQSRR